jgi:hypothetical protein
MEPFFEQQDLRATGRRMLIFLAFFVPAFFLGISYFLRYYPVPFPPFLVYLCALIPMMFAIGFNLLLLRSHHPVRWITTNSRVIYESPLSLLGRTFDIPISELASVSGIGDTDFASCTTISGVNHKFYYKHRGGRAFYHHLSQYIEEKSNKSRHPTTTSRSV